MSKTRWYIATKPYEANTNQSTLQTDICTELKENYCNANRL